MFGKDANTSFGSTGATTLISKNTEIIGDIHFSGDLQVEGKVKGNIFADDNSSSSVRIMEKGVVEGEICVPSVVINGLVEGDIHSSKHIELAAKATVAGNVYYDLIEMVMGSEVNGNLMHSVATQQEPKRISIEVSEQEFPEKSSVAE